MKELVKKYSINLLKPKLLGKKARFRSDCKLFPNFDITGKVIEINQINGIPLIKVIISSSGRRFSIDGGMSNLSFELLN